MCDTMQQIQYKKPIGGHTSLYEKAKSHVTEKLFYMRTNRLVHGDRIHLRQRSSQT